MSSNQAFFGRKKAPSPSSEPSAESSQRSAPLSASGKLYTSSRSFLLSKAEFIDYTRSPWVDSPTALNGKMLLIDIEEERALAENAEEIVKIADKVMKDNRQAFERVNHAFEKVNQAFERITETNLKLQKSVEAQLEKRARHLTTMFSKEREFESLWSVASASAKKQQQGEA
ncbi:hypothetical protein IV203_025496 [Nitzschia inconspicua]|uniref:Uncharacterized protein n=1 Tax=Nitzschia inconspicua TaxID=303405 RepID=A0A9K3LI91_9STRA|nr:hypothetical protein IV203_028273 [Nitzschia inconspicua]KAG7362612.1 hypothetical protein IV203_025496 [Nitzschia inconspicua]